MRIARNLVPVTKLVSSLWAREGTWSVGLRIRRRPRPGMCGRVMRRPWTPRSAPQTQASWHARMARV